ncbi:hypothetical protein N0V87_002964 [Didymella glomerata]|uniref:Rhodopsin domain-containing protein n=1 Tax=Didymella glomerata TaxID=749621 RepID=A0A9W8X2Z5_9PLEO|nr:hypothetical protein N0V87_002964 [Didymella glomerata]
MSALAASPDQSILTPEYVAFTNAPVLLMQFGSLFAVASVVVFARCYVRWFMIKSFGKDDWLMLLAYAFAAATFGTYVEQTKVGMGKHMAAITMDQAKYASFLRLRQVASILASIGVALIWQCIPIEATWNVKLRPPPFGTGTAKCFSPETFTSIGLFNTVTTIVTDFIIALLPVSLVWQLQLNLRAKLSLIMVLSLGIFAAVAAIVKAEIQKVILSDPDPFVHDRFTLWRFIEFDVGIIAASLPALKPLFNWFLGSVRSLTTRAARSNGAPNSLGYQKQSERSDKGIVLNEYNPRSTNTVRISSRPSNGRFFTVGPGKNSDESILPLHNVEEKPGGIVVTRDIHVS